MKNFKHVCLFLSIVLLFSTALTPVSFADSPYDYVISGEGVRMRSSPKFNKNNIIDGLSIGDPVSVLGKSKSNFLFVYAKGKLGYVYADYVLYRYSAVGTATTDINIRSGPGIFYETIVAIPKNTIFLIDGKEGSWLHVSYSLYSGYVYANYVDLNKIEQGDYALGCAFTTFLDYQNGREKNIQKAISLINEVKLEPGEEFSMLSTIGPITEEGGYFEAPEFKQIDGEILTVSGFGGGACQVTTTLYQAVKHAIAYSESELEITEIYHHAKDVSYVPIDEDATISWDSGVDFRFKNNNPYPIIILAYETYGVISIIIASTT